MLGNLVCGGWAAYFFVNCWYLSFSVWFGGVCCDSVGLRAGVWWFVVLMLWLS